MSKTHTKKRLYKVIFVNQGKIYEVCARQVRQGTFYGFVGIEGLQFGEGSALVIGPTEERLRAEFDGVKVSYVPIHAVIRIDEVGRQGSAKIIALSGKGDDIVHFPTVYPGHTPKKGD